MTKKIFAPLTAVAAMALVALSLLASSSTVSAAVNGLSQSATTVNSAAPVTLTIDADNAAGDVTLVATAGFFTACTDAPADAVPGTPDACAVQAGSAAFGATTTNTIVDDDAADNAGGNVDTLLVTWTAPVTTTPQTAQITVVQGTSTKSITINVRGAVDAVSLKILNGASTSATVCEGTEAHVVRSTTATQGLVAGTLCAVVTDSAGNRLPAMTVVYTTTDGTITGTTDVTGGTGQRATLSTIAAGTTGASGDTATVTASVGGKQATDTIRFGGDPASCEITTTPTSVQVGGSATISVNVKDATGGPVPDHGGGAVGVATNSSVAVQQVNSGQGANAAILNANPAIVNGVAQTTAIAAIQGAIALGAASNVAGNTTSCTGTLLATGQIIPPNPGDGGDAGEFSGDIADEGSSLVTFTGSFDALIEAAEDAGVLSISVTVDGEWVVYIVGAPDFVNAEFVDEFEDSTFSNDPFVLFVR